MGISTIGDFAKALLSNDPNVEKELGKFFLTAKEWIQGYGSDTVCPTEEDPKSIGAQETLAKDCDTYEEVEPYFSRLAEEISQRCLSAGKEAKSLTVSVKTLDFRLHSRAVPFLEATRSSVLIKEKAKEGFRALMEKLGYPKIRQVGIALTRLVDPQKETVQMSLWNYEDYEKKDATKLLIESLNRKMDKPMLKRASQAEKGKKNGNR